MSIRLFGRRTRLNITKRQKFIAVVVVLTLGLFVSEYILGKSGFFVAFTLAFLTDFLLFWSDDSDIRENFSPSVFILPFLYSLSFGLFYFLVPNRFLTRILITSLYGVGLYSILLSQNIFTVASIRTIALLSSARTVSFIITIVTYFFLANIILSLDLFIVPTAILLFLMSYLLETHSIWTYTLERTFFPQRIYILILSICFAQMSMILWFWPSNPTIVAIFLTGFFYAVTGLSHVWFERRLFKEVLLEYIWAGVFVSLILILFTSWKG
ncbi:MAG: hypothetical protein ABH816_03865 [Candidatus Levyibacteriota bacterium]